MTADPSRYDRALDGPRAYPRDVELPGDPLPLRRYLARLRRERVMREHGDDASLPLVADGRPS